MDEKPVSVKIDKEVYSKLSIVCKKKGYKIKAYIEKAILMRIENEQK